MRIQVPKCMCTAAAFHRGTEPQSGTPEIKCSMVEILGNGKFDCVGSNMAANVIRHAESASKEPKESNRFHSIHIVLARNVH